MKTLALFPLATLLIMGTQLTAQDKAPCSLLTANDVSALGATGEGIPSDMQIPNGPYKGQTMKMCAWRMKAGGLNLSANRMPPGASRTAIEAELTKTWEMLTAKGWKQEKKSFGSVTCNSFTPPPGEKKSPADTSCLTVSKGILVNADVLSMTPIAIEKVKAVIDAASSRL